MLVGIGKTKICRAGCRAYRLEIHRGLCYRPIGWKLGQDFHVIILKAEFLFLETLVFALKVSN